MAVKKTDKLQVVRPLDKVEQFHAARQHLGLFYASIITARYTTTTTNTDETHKIRLIHGALATLINKQPFLRIGVAKTELSKPSYVHVPRVDLREQVDNVTIAVASQEQYDQKLAELLMQRHSQPWQDTATRPPWRLTIVTQSRTGEQLNGHSEAHTQQQQQQQHDLIFAYHHSLMDASAGAMFHEQLLAALNSQITSSPDTEPQYILEFANSKDLPPSRDDVIPDKLSKRFIGKAVWHEYGPKALQKTPTPWWPLKPIDYNLTKKTSLIVKEIPAENLAALLQSCRAHGTTLTGLINAFALTSLARRLDPKDAVSFRSLTPIDYRRITNQVPAVKKIFVGTLANCVTVEEQKYDPEALAAVRAPPSVQDASFKDTVWSQAKRVGDTLAEQRSRLPVNDFFKLLKYVGDWDDFFKKMNGKQRDHAWELSNVGALKVPRIDAVNGDSAAAPWHITRACFSSSCQPVGTAFAIRAASVPGGPLCITLIWQEGSVPEDLPAGLASDMQEWALLFGEGDGLRN